MSGAIVNAGLTFTTDSASDGGRPVSLASIVNDTSGRFTDTQRRYAKRLQEQQTADALSEAVHQHGSRHKGFSAQRGSGGDVVSLSTAALDLINQTSAQGALAPTSDVVKPAQSFSNTLQIGGFSLSVSASADFPHVTVVNGPD